MPSIGKLSKIDPEGMKATFDPTSEAKPIIKF
jgi:hypothetical protein